MNAHTFHLKCLELRREQKEYFRSRTPVKLALCRQLESQMRAALQVHIEGVPAGHSRAVSRMLLAQSEYYRTATLPNLKKAKHLERLVDQFVTAYFDTQQSLF